MNSIGRASHCSPAIEDFRRSGTRLVFLRGGNERQEDHRAHKYCRTRQSFGACAIVLRSMTYSTPVFPPPTTCGEPGTIVTPPAPILIALPPKPLFVVHP